MPYLQMPCISFFKGLNPKMKEKKKKQMTWWNHPIIGKILPGVFSGQETPEEETLVGETFKSSLEWCLLPHQLPATKRSEALDLL